MVFLIGFMGSGKSVVGQALARRLDYSFLDLDDRIEATTGCSIPKIFDRQGEAAFRELEHQQLQRLLSEVGDASAVVALGGGAFAQPRNVELLEQSGGCTVWLDGPPELLLERCQRHGTDRPLARDPERFRALYRERIPFYARARLRVEAAGATESVVKEILDALATLPARRRA